MAEAPHAFEENENTQPDGGNCRFHQAGLKLATLERVARVASAMSHRPKPTYIAKFGYIL
jgi:hypothetical protein